MNGGGRPLPFVLLAITGPERETADDAVLRVAEAGGGRVAVLLRDPRLAAGALRRWVERLLPACRRAGALLLVHGSAAAAREVGADGVHLPERAGSAKDVREALGRGLVGASRHDAAGLAAAAGADYATLSPVFATPHKGRPIGLRRLAALCESAPLPVVALGGVTPERAGACRAAGAAGIAAVRAVWEGDPGANARRLLEAWGAAPP